MTATIQIPVLSAQNLGSKIEKVQKSKDGKNFVNVTIRSVHIHDANNNKKAIDKLRWSIYFFTVVLAVSLLVVLIYFNLQNH